MAEVEVSNAVLAKLGIKPKQQTISKKFVRGPKAGEVWTHDLSPPELPAVFVSWSQAQAVCEKLNELEQAPGRYRLPTEAEWEYACRAGTSGRWFWGKDPAHIAAHANVADSATNKYLNLGRPGHDAGTLFFDVIDDDQRPFTTAAGVKPNAFGLQHMIGNAAEWVSDHFRMNYLGATTDGVRVDPPSPPAPAGDKRPRVLRGGGWASGPKRARAAARLVLYEDSATWESGVRIVRVPGR